MNRDRILILFLSSALVVVSAFATFLWQAKRAAAPPLVDHALQETATPPFADSQIQIDETHKFAHNILGVYDLSSGQLQQQIQTQLRNILALAYSPSSGRLYVIDFAWAVPEESGLFALNIEGGVATSRKIANLEHPTAMAFDSGGTLFITVLGQSSDGQEPNGKLLSVTGL